MTNGSLIPVDRDPRKIIGKKRSFLYFLAAFFIIALLWSIIGVVTGSRSLPMHIADFVPHPTPKDMLEVEKMAPYFGVIDFAGILILILWPARILQKYLIKLNLNKEIRRIIEQEDKDDAFRQYLIDNKIIKEEDISKD
ncbi:hypothetical protein [Akkermansia sp.]|uniref:hypothetical protein n=1 Tax=Akkermansia sp. TaxID=1872421 RepID=UPI0025B8F182|nr:hypothetical protein [Akkermansia sp.]MCD8063639.1 hypothetical protein [Akkermansia sp.]